MVGIITLLPGGRGTSELTQISMAVTIFGLNAEKVGVAITQVIISSVIGAFLAPAIGWILDKVLSER